MLSFLKEEIERDAVAMQQIMETNNLFDAEMDSVKTYPVLFFKDMDHFCAWLNHHNYTFTRGEIHGDIEHHGTMLTEWLPDNIVIHMKPNYIYPIKITE